jgi:eukaryotic-like serine/threonine-protein kinase
MRDLATVALLALVTAGGLGCGGQAPARGTTPEGGQVELPPDDAPAAPPASETVRRGEALLAQGDVAGARAAFEEAIAADPRDARAHLNLGIVLEMTDEPAGAERAYRTAIEVRPDFGEALNNLGLLLLETGRAAEARGPLEQAVEAAPHLADAWVNLALTREVSGDPEGAVKAWRRAAELEPADPTVRANLGLAQLAMGDGPGALATLRAALSVARGHAAALSAIGSGLRRAGDPEAAVEAMAGAIDAHDGGPTPALLAELGLAQHAAGQGDAAEATLRRALELDPAYAMGHFLLASMLAGRGAYDGAIEHFEAVLRHEPKGPQAEKARARLEAARRASGVSPAGPGRR